MTEKKKCYQTVDGQIKLNVGEKSRSLKVRYHPFFIMLLLMMFRLDFFAYLGTAIISSWYWQNLCRSWVLFSGDCHAFGGLESSL